MNVHLYIHVLFSNICGLQKQVIFLYLPSVFTQQYYRDQCKHSFYAFSPPLTSVLTHIYRDEMRICNRGRWRVPSSDVHFTKRCVCHPQTNYGYPDADLQLDSSGFWFKIISTVLPSDASWTCTQSQLPSHTDNSVSLSVNYWISTRLMIIYSHNIKVLQFVLFGGSLELNLGVHNAGIYV